MTTEYYSAFPYGANVSFEVYPVETLGTGFKNVKVEGIVDHETAILLKLDPAAVHAQVYSRLPVGTPNDYRSYPYLKIRHPNGQVQCLGIPWINLATVQTVMTQSINVRISAVTPADVERVSLALRHAGYEKIEITLI